MSQSNTNADLERGFARVSAANPCPVCEKADWCLIATDGTAAICARTEPGSVKRCGDAGWLHRLVERPVRTRAGKPTPKTSPRNWQADAERNAGMMTEKERDWLLARLGLPAGALDAIPLLGCAGANSFGPITSWPEVDADGTVVGITDRTPGPDKDDKKMRAGGKRGLTLPTGWCGKPGPAFVVEGPTDAAALSAAGLSAVGRPSKDGGGKLLLALFAGWPQDRGIVIVGENDPPAPDGRLDGRDAAIRLARKLATGLARPVSWTLPPAGAKDVRAWLTHPDRGEIAWPDRGAELAALLLAGAVAVLPGRDDPPAGVPNAGDGPGPVPPGRAEIVVGTDEHRVNDEAVAALAREVDIYQRGGMLVHLIEQEADSDEGETVRRAAGAPVVRELPKPLLRERLTRVARWIRLEDRDGQVNEIPVHPPGWAVDTVNARGRWPHVRRLEAVVTHPILLPNGQILNRDGYHRGTGILVRLPRDLTVTVPDSPTRVDVAAAVDVLLDPLADFPFETPHHRAALVAGLLTPLAWFAFAGQAPLFLIDKNVRGAGAGLMADVVALTLTGRRFSVMTYTSDREELRKRITTAAVEGERLILFDNLAGAVGNDILDAALTTDRWKDRLLGGNRMFDGPLHVTWFGTGNNVQLAADTSRRVCHIRMESADERPELRDNFRYADLRAHVRANRGKLLSSALTILRGWVVAGRPTHGLRAWGSYEPWSSLVREAVVFAGLPDPGETRLALQTAADRDAGAMAVILDGVEAMDADRRGVTATEIVGRLKGVDDGSPDWLAEMRSAVEELCGKLDARLLGFKFRHFKRRNFNGKMLDVAGAHRQHGNRWTVIAAAKIRSEPSPTSPASPAAGGSGVGDAGDVGDDPVGEKSAPAGKVRRRPNPNRGVGGNGGGR